MTHHKHHSKHHSVHEIAAAGVHGAHHVRRHRKHGGKAGGGEVESPMHGDNEAEKDLRQKEVEYSGGKPEHEAKEMGERKRGGRAKRKHGGHVVHHHSGHVKHVGAVHGAAAHHHAGRKPRKAGGRAGKAHGGSEMNPFTSARHGTPAKGRKLEPETMG